MEIIIKLYTDCEIFAHVNSAFSRHSDILLHFLLLTVALPFPDLFDCMVKNVFLVCALVFHHHRELT